VDFTNKLPALQTNIMFHTVIILKDVSKMLQLLNPGEWSAIQEDWGNLKTITDVL
jgi:hypothetical protein